MKRVLPFSLIAALALFVSGAALAQTTPQSLGDYARAHRKAKNEPAPETKQVYTNDNLPSAAAVSVVGNTTSEPAAGQDGTSAEKPGAENKTSADKKKDEPQLKEGQSAVDRQKALDAWKEKLKAQQDKIAQLSHELDLTQQEYRIKAAEFYADTARRTQNPTGFAKDDADYKKQISDKQKAVDDAKAKLSEMQDEARKAGAPSSVTD